MANVQIRNLKKSYGTTSILKGIDIEVPDGSFVALVGPSGCGKSTLLRAIAGLEEVDSGEILVGGKRVNDVPPKDRDVAMVFQNYALYPHLTVRENMSFSLKLRGVDTASIRTEVEKAAGILGLGPMLDRLPRQLSGGQRQRVAMGRAIVRNPQVFLFDEPLSNLDAKLRVQMRSEIKALQQRLGTTTVYVTHDQMEAMTMADLVVIMHDGKVEQAAAPLDLYDFPDNVFVAGFIGSPVMNMLEGLLHRDATGTWLHAEGIGLRLEGAVQGVHGQKVICGIRPEHFELVNTPEAPGCMAGVTTLVEPTGPETHVTVELDKGQKLIAVFPQRHHFVRGKPLVLKPQAGHLHLFDATTGQRLNGRTGV